MRSTALAFAATLALTGAAFAQATTTPGSTVGNPTGSAERNLNNPGSVKSNAEKGMPGRDLPGATGTVAPGSTGTGATMPPAGTAPATR
ncbi:hypothetical protein [Methylobacterium gregans]|uniref:Uncharacterized protein n=1 Tax=Methylobacterium gregans TaxID=374424 RepID=A0AA37HPL2_9HYPH|nr:hypothetical protein [Methylobacterium gregans]MDQ0522060.1 hypothetical protein [Methylobacterium gregans]GJD78652.1 hypothetical protein NBEOAGPD_1870 [Methylobacterium gregans]GLS51903.1 hypothetical protein GCM10007886_00850 [Methylobacterium gregans]